jgi:hypothetical protein
MLKRLIKKAFTPLLKTKPAPLSYDELERRIDNQTKKTEVGHA